MGSQHDVKAPEVESRRVPSSESPESKHVDSANSPRVLQRWIQQHQSRTPRDILSLQSTLGNQVVALMVAQRTGASAAPHADGVVEPRGPSWTASAQPWYFGGARQDGGEHPTEVGLRGSAAPDRELQWS